MRCGLMRRKQPLRCGCQPVRLAAVEYLRRARRVQRRFPTLDGQRMNKLLSTLILAAFAAFSVTAQAAAPAADTAASAPAKKADKKTHKQSTAKKADKSASAPK
jgi:ribosomal protein L12E/L44/L45/RPP1/RPP2